MSKTGWIPGACWDKTTLSKFEIVLKLYCVCELADVYIPGENPTAAQNALSRISTEDTNELAILGTIHWTRLASFIAGGKTVGSHPGVYCFVKVVVSKFSLLIVNECFFLFYCQSHFINI